MNAPSLPTESKGPADSLLLPARLMWFAVGPGLLFILLLKIVIEHLPLFGLADAAVALTTLLMAAGRWYEQRSGEGTDTNGDPTTDEDCVRYVRHLCLAVFAGFIVAHLIGYFLSK